MSKETEQVNALLGGANKTPDGGAEDWKAKYETLKAEYDAKRPMLGRIDELSAKDRRISELERELKAARAGGSATHIAAQLTPEERGEIPDDYVAVAAKLASRATAEAMAGVNDEMARMRLEREEEQNARREAERGKFVSRINKRFPGFLQSINPGGSNCGAWSEFLGKNKGSVCLAFNDLDFDTLEYHIERFYREVLEVRPPNGEPGGASVPDPVTQGGGTPSLAAGSEKTYTAEEYDALDEKCMKLRQQGKIEEYRKLREELDSALSEGRVRE